MSTVLWHVTMSLDGFIAPEDYSTEWMFESGGAGPDGTRGHGAHRRDPCRAKGL